MNRLRNTLYFLSNPPTVWKWLLAAIDIGSLAGILAWSWEVFALVFTAILILWLAYELHRQNRLSHYPTLTMRWASGVDGWKLMLENGSGGIAFNIALDQVVRDDVAYVFNLSGINAIYPGQQAEIKIRRTDLRKGIIGAPSSEDLQLLETDSVITRIYFSRADNLRTLYFTEVEIKNPPTVRILSTNWY